MKSIEIGKNGNNQTIKAIWFHGLENNVIFFYVTFAHCCFKATNNKSYVTENQEDVIYKK